MKHLIFQIFNSLIRDMDVYQNRKETHIIYVNKELISYHHNCLYYDKKIFNRWFNWLGMEIVEEYIVEWFVKNTDFTIDYCFGKDLNKFPSHTECIIQIGRKDTSLYFAD